MKVSETPSVSDSLKQDKRKEKTVKVRDLILLLESIEKIQKNPLISNPSDSKGEIRELIDVLQPIKNLGYEKFLDKLKSIITLEAESPVQLQFSDESIKNLTLKEIREICTNADKVSKSVLEVIGSQRLNLSQSMLKSNSKEKVAGLILSSLDNLDILDSIANKASNP